MEDKAPVIIGGITIGGVLSLFEATILFLKAMGWLQLDNDRTMALLTYGRILLPIVVTALATWWVARHTTSLALPTDKDNVRLSRPDNELAIEEKKATEKAILERSIQR